MAETVDSTWEDEFISDLVGGLNLSKPPTAIQKNEHSNNKNIIIFKNSIRPDTGYKKFAQTVRGNPRGTFQFFKKDNSDFTILLTNDTFYVYNISSKFWDYVSNGTDTTVTSTVSAGATVIPVADRTGFAADEYIGVVLDDGSQHKSQIDSGYVATTGAGSITINDAIPTGRQVDSGNVFLEAAVFNGSDDIQPSFVPVPSDDKLVFTNGVDSIQVYDGSTVEKLSGLPSGGNTTCRVVGLHENHLLLMNTTEGGVRFPQRVRNSDTANITEWANGNAGSEDLYDSEDHIVAGAPLGTYFIIYKERSIYRQEYVGTSDKLFVRESMISGEGALGQDAVVDLGDNHMFAGNSNFYRYRGGFDIEPIGDNIYFKVYGSTGELNPGSRNRSFSVYIEELDEIWFFYPADGSQYPNRLLRHTASTGAWVVREFPHTITGFGFFESRDIKKWTDLQGDWFQQDFSWNSQRLLSNSPTTHLCGNENNQVYEYDYINADDDGNAISWSVETKDFFAPGYATRVDSLSVYGKGNDIKLEWSGDEGKNWSILGTFTSIDRKVHTEFGQFSSDVFRFRISGTGIGAEINWIKFEHARDVKHYSVS